MTGCSFDPTKDFSCYKIPTTPAATCPATAIMAGAACSMPGLRRLRRYDRLHGLDRRREDGLLRLPGRRDVTHLELRQHDRVALPDGQRLLTERGSELAARRRIPARAAPP